MRTAIDILNSAFDQNSGVISFDLLPVEKLKQWADNRQNNGGYLPSKSCLEKASSDYYIMSASDLFFRYSRCLPYLFEKSRMSDKKTSEILDFFVKNNYDNMRFWQGLLNSYFSFEKEAYQQGVHNWNKIRTLLLSHLGVLIKKSEGKKDWVNYLSQYPDLLSDTHGEKLSKFCLEYKISKAKELREKLKIPLNSWFWKEYLINKIKIAENRPDFEILILHFIDEMDNEELYSVRNEGIKRLIEIYYKKGLERKANQNLLDFAIKYWSYPYKNSANGRMWSLISDGAYQMVLSWYTRGILTTFINTLRGSNFVQDDRLNFWMNYVDSIGGRFFILMGDDFIINNKFSSIAERYPQNFGKLSGDRSNNAFIFDFGYLYAVVFSEIGNALYVYNKQNIPSALNKCNPNTQINKKVIEEPLYSLEDLKNKSKVYYWKSQTKNWQPEVANFLVENGIYPDKK